MKSINNNIWHLHSLSIDESRNSNSNFQHITLLSSSMKSNVLVECPGPSSERNEAKDLGRTYVRQREREEPTNSSERKGRTYEFVREKGKDVSSSERKGRTYEFVRKKGKDVSSSERKGRTYEFVREKGKNLRIRQREREGCKFVREKREESTKDLSTFETLDFTIHFDSTPTFFYFDLYLNTAYTAHYVYSSIYI